MCAWQRETVWFTPVDSLDEDDMVGPEQPSADVADLDATAEIDAGVASA